MVALFVSAVIVESRSESELLCGTRGGLATEVGRHTFHDSPGEGAPVLHSTCIVLERALVSNEIWNPTLAHMSLLLVAAEKI